MKTKMKSRHMFVLAMAVACVAAIPASRSLGAFGVPPVATAPAIKDGRIPEPSDDKEAAALKNIRDIYKDEYAKKSSEDKHLLAEKLLEESKAAAGDPASQFVLLREARDLGVAAGEVDLAMRASKAMGETFAVDAFETNNKTLAALRPVLKTPDVLVEAYNAAVENAVEAAEKEQFDAATHAADLASLFASAAKSTAKSTEALGLKQAIAAQSKAYDDYKLGLETLKKTKLATAIADANQSIGLYTALYLKQWTDGLKLIAKGNSSTWAPIAEADLKNPSASAEMTAVADQWWDLAGKEGGHRYRLLERAEYWYNLALADADGVNKTKIEKRLEQIAAGKPTYMGGATEAAKSVLPTTLELAKLKDVLKQYQAGDQSKQAAVVSQFSAIEARLNTDLKDPKTSTVPPAEFFARLKADIDLRKLMEDNGAANLVTASLAHPMADMMLNYTLGAHSKDDLAERMMGFEKIFADQMADKTYKTKFDGTLYSALRTYVDNNPNTYTTAASKIALADGLKQKGVKTAAVDRFRAQVPNSGTVLGQPPAQPTPKPPAGRGGATGGATGGTTPPKPGG